MLKTYGEALIDALGQLFRKDDSIIMLGRGFGNIDMPNLSAPLQREFPERFISMPISELANAGFGIGMALAGFRPLVSFGTASFMFEAWPQVVNEAANIHYMSGGRTACPVVYHCYAGFRGSAGAQHCHCPQAMLLNAPGIKMMAPATPADVAGLLPAALYDGNPVIFIDQPKLLGVKGEAPGSAVPLPFGKAEIARPGADVTVAAYSIMVQVALEAAERAAGQGVKAEVVNLRTLAPMDWETILGSVARTGRLVVADECHVTGSVASHIAGIVARDGFDLLKAPVKIVATPDVPIPFSPALENYLMPTCEKVEEAILEVAGLSPRGRRTMRYPRGGPYC